MRVKARFSLGLTGLTWPALLVSDKHSFQGEEEVWKFTQLKIECDWLEVLCARRLLCNCYSLALGFGGSTVLHRMNDGRNTLIFSTWRNVGPLFSSWFFSKLLPLLTIVECLGEVCKNEGVSWIWQAVLLPDLQIHLRYFQSLSSIDANFLC